MVKITPPQVPTNQQKKSPPEKFWIPTPVGGGFRVHNKSFVNAVFVNQTLL